MGIGYLPIVLRTVFLNTYDFPIFIQCNPVPAYVAAYDEPPLDYSFLVDYDQKRAKRTHCENWFPNTLVYGRGVHPFVSSFQISDMETYVLGIE